jgi:hypothetical protein
LLSPRKLVRRVAEPIGEAVVTSVLRTLHRIEEGVSMRPRRSSKADLPPRLSRKTRVTCRATKVDSAMCGLGLTPTSAASSSLRKPSLRR